MNCAETIYAFPMCVGMNRLRGQVPCVFCGVPHVRGDEPGFEWLRK